MTGCCRLFTNWTERRSSNGRGHGRFSGANIILLFFFITDAAEKASVFITSRHFWPSLIFYVMAAYI